MTYTEAFAMYILECKALYADLEERVVRGQVPAGQSAKLTVTIPPAAISQIRRDLLTAKEA